MSAPVWTWMLAEAAPSTVRLRELTKAHGRTATWRLDGPATAQFSIDGGADETVDIVALATDLRIYRDSTEMFHGRIGTESDDIDPTNHNCQFSATDYRGMLAYRRTGTAGAAYTATAAGVIAYNLITTTQAATGGDWGITAGVGCTTGTVRDKTINPGKPVVESIDEMGHLDGGYEWEISPAMEANFWHPQRGANNGVVLDWPGRIAKVRRLLTPANFANSAIASGSQGLTPVAATTAGIATDPRGRWDVAGAYPTIVNQATLDDRAPWLLDQASTLRPTYSVTLRPNDYSDPARPVIRWGGPADVWLGDTVVLDVQKGRLAVNAAHRVIEVSIQVDDNDQETVIMGLLAA